MNSQYRERLVAIAAGYLSKVADTYLNTVHYNALHYSDDSRTEFRSVEEVQKVESAVETACSAIAEEIIDECETRGLDFSKPEEEIYALLMSVLSSSDTFKKIYQKIDRAISDLS